MSDNINNVKKNGNLLIRVRSAAILTLIAFATIIPGGYPCLCICIFISAFGMMEFMRVVGVHKSTVAIVSYIALAGVYAAVFFEKKELLVPLIMLHLLLLFAIMVIKFPKYTVIQVLMAFSGLIYIGLGLSYLYQIRAQLTNGAFIIWLVFICSWISDSGAYLVGISSGKHKAFPVLSPKKSVEGCIGGVLASVLMGLLYKAVLGLFDIELVDYLELIIICACGSVISQAGDLAASAIKRNFEIKDYGHLIPGHGGIMDRFDSIIFVAPLVYYLGIIFV